MTLRATTNLVVPKGIQLSRAELKQGFLYVYNKGYKGREAAFMNKIWLSVVMPEIANDPSYGTSFKGMRSWATDAAKNLKAGHLRIQKINDQDDQHFKVSIPLAEFNPHEVLAIARKYRLWFTNGKNEDTIESAEDLQNKFSNAAENSEVQSHSYTNAQVIKAMHLDAKGAAELGQTLLGLRMLVKGRSTVVMADFKINMAQAQQLTTTEWMMIRPIDLYPLLLQWISAQFSAKEAPLAAFPVSKIAATLPPLVKGQARVNDEGLSIDPRGAALWLPKELNNTARYEDLYSQVGQQGDGSFGLLDFDAVATMEIGGDKVETKLPKNIPVLIDWVNNKYSYTQSSGLLKVQDLSRFKAADEAHIRSILMQTPIDAKLLMPIMAMAMASGVEPTFKFTAAELMALAEDDPHAADLFHGNGAMTFEAYWDKAAEFFMQHHNDTPKMKDVRASIAVFAPLSRFMILANAAIRANMDAVNLRYAVATVSTVLANTTLFAKYASDFEAVEMKANQICAPAMNQNVQEGWEPPSIPLLSEKIGFLPHQKKVRNLLKDSPDFAILPVQAGGGKSVLAITDILYEIKANRSQPYLILCPSHLVAQYVKEIVFFTSGKLNVVPINNYTMFRNGLKRLTQMLENAPRNTVVVADYDCLKAKKTEICYGTTSVAVYPVIEFLRQFNFGYAMLDESHYMKNSKSQRTRAAMVLIADIPKKRLASGTMAHDSPSDLASQIAMLDPTLFGDKARFNDTFGETVRGDRVIEWKPGAQQKIMSMIKSRVVVAKAMRKEWAALLPQAEEKFFGVELTETQHQVYTAILEEALDKMKEDAKGNKTLQKFFASQGLKMDAVKDDAETDPDEEDDGEEDILDENAGSDLESLLGFYLARLEQFITAPARDVLGDKLLTGNDRNSPKVAKIIERMYLHIKADLPGKVLVFTNYTESAEEIYDALPPDLKTMALLYKAADKVETGNVFENDKRKKIMIGVENSMNTGLNLQFVSRLIRVETVWNPGTLEQGNSRVNRPELKKADRRDKIYYDWIMANRTLDITKISRLISKVIAVGKFENAEDPAYQEVPDVDVIPMNADSIQAMNDWSANLVEYAEAYQSYQQVQADDYRAYREKHGDLKLEPITVAPTPKDAKLMAETPYTPGLELYNSGQLGLVRVDEYLRQDAALNGGDDEDDGGADDEPGENGLSPKQERQREAFKAIVGQAVHTEFGDGIVKSVMTKGKRMNITLNSGGLIRVGMAAAFVITRKMTSTKDIRTQLLKEVGQLPMTAPLTIPSAILRQDNVGARRAEKERQRQEDEEEAAKVAKRNASLSVELTFNVSNGFLGITYFIDGEGDAKSALQALGFRPTPQFAMAEVKNSSQLIKQFNAWNEAGFTLDEISRKANISNAFYDLSQIMKTGKIAKGYENFNFASRNQLQNFFRSEVKPSTLKKAIKPYPMIEDEKAYIVMPLRGQPANVAAIKVKAPGIRWQRGPESLVYYGLDLAQTGNKIKEIMAAGIHIANIVDLKADFKKLKKVKIRNDTDETIKM